jgi:superfamily II DNA or RNA helicase
MSSKRKIDLIDRAETGSVVKRERPDESTNDQLPNFYFTANANITSNQNLWKHQREAYQKVHDFIARNSSTSNLLLVVLPTGTGKSGLAHILPFGLKGRVLMITHNTDSCYQMMHSEDFLYRRRILNEGVPGPKVHVVQNQDDMIHLKENYSHNDLFIANIHKFDLVGKWKNSIGQFFQFIIIDEGHHIPAKTYNRVVINQLLTNSTNIVLLTATPNRRDKLPLNATVVYDYSMRRAVEEKLIKHPCLITYTPEYTVLNQDGRSVVRKITEAQTPQLKKKINSALLKSKEVRSQLLAMMIKLIEEKRRETQVHHQAIVVCKTQSQVDQVTMELNRNYFVYDKPIVALSYHCDLSSSQRLHVQQEMKSHRCDVVVHCGLLNEGHDCPTISITVILCKVEWIGKFSQVVGRSIRYLHDKSLIDNTSHIIMNHFFVGKLWDQYKSEAHISNRPTSLNNTNNPRENNQTKPARNNQRKRLSTNANNGRECRFTDNVEASNDESDNEEHDQLR